MTQPSNPNFSADAFKDPRDKLRVPDDHPRLFLKLADEFLDAAKTILQAKPTQFDSWPLIFLTCQACELYLKSFLRTKGVPAGDLAKKKIFGHDLDLGLKKAKDEHLDLGPTLVEDLEDCIKYFGGRYNRREFQYSYQFAGAMIPCGKFIEVLEQLRARLNC